MARRKSDQPPPADAPPSGPVEPAPGPACIRCGRGNDAVFGEVTRDIWGWWLHAGCRHWTEVEIEQARGR
jgi:hypothetical protein